MRSIKKIAKLAVALLLLLSMTLSLASCDVVELIAFFGANEREQAEAMLDMSEYLGNKNFNRTTKIEQMLDGSLRGVEYSDELQLDEQVGMGKHDGKEMFYNSTTTKYASIFGEQSNSNTISSEIGYNGEMMYLGGDSFGNMLKTKCSAERFSDFYSYYVGSGSTIVDTDDFADVLIQRFEDGGFVEITFTGYTPSGVDMPSANVKNAAKVLGISFADIEGTLKFTLAADDYRLIKSNATFTASSTTEGSDVDYSFTMNTVCEYPETGADIGRSDLSSFMEINDLDYLLRAQSCMQDLFGSSRLNFTVSSNAHFYGIDDTDHANLLKKYGREHSVNVGTKLDENGNSSVYYDLYSSVKDHNGTYSMQYLYENYALTFLRNGNDIWTRDMRESDALSYVYSTLYTFTFSASDVKSITGEKDTNGGLTLKLTLNFTEYEADAANGFGVTLGDAPEGKRTLTLTFSPEGDLVYAMNEYTCVGDEVQYDAVNFVGQDVFELSYIK